MYVWKRSVLSLKIKNNSWTEKDEINVPIAFSAFRDGDQGPSKVTKKKLMKSGNASIISHNTPVVDD